MGDAASYVRDVLGWDDAVITPLRGGYRNDVVRARTPSADVVVKRFVEAPENPMYPTLPDAERCALDVLDGTGLAPRPLRDAPRHDTDGADVVVYEWVDGPIWPGPTTAPARPAAATGDALAAIHRVASDERWCLRRLLVDPVDVLDHARSMLAPAPDDLATQWRRLDARWARRHAPASGRRDALVHTDGGPGNQVLVIGLDPDPYRRVVFIDWQCPGVGDPVEDVATVVSPAMHVLYECEPLDPTEVSGLLAAYDPAGSIDTGIERRAAFHLRIAAYCAHRAGTLAECEPAVAARYRLAFELEATLLSCDPTEPARSGASR